MAIGGLLVDWSWRLLFIVDGGTTILFGATVYFFIHETRPTATPTVAGTEAASATPAVWRDGVYALLMLSSVAFSTAVFSFLTILPLTVTLWAGYPAAVYGAIVGFNGLLIAAFEVSVVAWLKRFRRLRVSAVGFVFSSTAPPGSRALPSW
jgi:hypothetical protein